MGTQRPQYRPGEIEDLRLELFDQPAIFWLAGLQFRIGTGTDGWIGQIRRDGPIQRKAGTVYSHSFRPGGTAGRYLAGGFEGVLLSLFPPAPNHCHHASPGRYWVQLLTQ